MMETHFILALAFLFSLNNFHLFSLEHLVLNTSNLLELLRKSKFFFGHHLLDEVLGNLVNLGEEVRAKDTHRFVHSYPDLLADTQH
jgi:hypothetical protein